MKRIFQLRRWAALAAAAVIAAAPGGLQAQDEQDEGAYSVVGYDRSIVQEDFDTLDRAAVRRLQGQLADIYSRLPDWRSDFAARGKPLDDGVVGPVTLSWLQRYGFNFKLAHEDLPAKKLPPHVERIVAFGKAHPAELAILLSRDFEDWDAAQSAGDKKRDFAVRREGREGPLLDLVNRYRASRKTPPAETRDPAGSGSAFTYVLTAADLELLGGKSKPLAVLATLKDKEFQSKEEMQVALLHALGGREEVLKLLWPMVQAHTKESFGYLFDKEQRQALAKDGSLPQEAMETLEKLGTFYLPSRQAFDAFVKEKLTTDSAELAPEEVEQLAEHTKVFDNYHLSQQTLDTIRGLLDGTVLSEGVPASIVKVLGEIQDIDYAEAGLFNSAAMSKVAFGLGMCPQNTPRNSNYARSVLISDIDLAALNQELKVLKRPSLGLNKEPKSWEEQYNTIVELRAKSEICNEGDNQRGKEVVIDLYMHYLQAALSQVAYKKLSGDIAPLRIVGHDCGCALDDMSGVVYGFYPYWHAGKAKQAAQPINFRVFNRMAFYGLTVDQGGDLRLGSRAFDVRDGSRDSNEFVRTARQYNSNVDWLIRKSNWDDQTWAPGATKEGKEKMLNKLRDNLVALMDAKLTDLESRIKPVTSLGLWKPPTRGDGITLYFPNYPTDIDSGEAFKDFYRKLRTDLRKRGLWLNILVSQETLVAGSNLRGGVFGLSSLAELRSKRDQEELRIKRDAFHHNETILVLLNEPSSEAKKRLRAAIENESTLYGAERVDLLRSIIPVLHFDRRNWQQLDDDIVYMRDNFGGVGFWAPDLENLEKPVIKESVPCAEAKLMAECLLKNYRDDTTLADSVPSVWELEACVHRWWLQLFLGALAIAAVALTVWSLRSCDVQNRIEEYSLWIHLLFVVPALAAAGLLMLYDPFFVHARGSKGPYIVMAVVALACGLAFASYRRKRRRLPMRERGQAPRQTL